MPHRLKHIHIAQITFYIRPDITSIKISIGEYSLILLAIYNTLNRKRELFCKISTIRCTNDFQIRIAPKSIRRKGARYNFRFAMLRAYEYHQILYLALQKFLAVVCYNPMEPLLTVLRIHVWDELTQTVWSVHSQ